MIFLLILLVIQFESFSFNFTNNAISFSNRTISNFYEISFSASKKNVIYSNTIKGNAPQLFTISNNQEKQITDDVFLKYYPVINNNGVFAYALSEYSVSTSKIYLNNNLLKESDSGYLYKNLAINDDYLVFSCVNFYAYVNWLCVYNLYTNSYKTITVDGYIQKINFINNNNLLIQIYSLQTLSMDIYRYDLSNNSLSVFLNSEYDEIINKVNYNNCYTIDTISGDKDATLLFNTYYEIYNYQLANPLANSNDFLGRISWHQADRTKGLIKLYEKSKDDRIKVMINNIINNILGVNNESLGITGVYNPSFLWASKKYSIDKVTPISLLVDNSMIVYSLILAVNNNMVGDPALKLKIINNLISMYDYYEQYFDNDEKLYRVPKGIAFVYDGVWCPYNWQNTFGLCLLELYKATGDIKYRDRALALANKFKSEFVYTIDNRLLWHYWPARFYQGWTTNQNISINTPEKPPSTDVLYEDLSHAGLNLEFMLAVHRDFPNEIFSDHDFELLRNTIDGFMIAGNKFSRFMSGDITYQKPDYSFLPMWNGWCQLNYDKLNKYFLNIIPKIWPDFEGDMIHNYLYPMNPTNSSQRLIVESIKYDIKGKELFRNKKEYGISEIPGYFNYKKSMPWLDLLL